MNQQRYAGCPLALALALAPFPNYGVGFPQRWPSHIPDRRAHITAEPGPKWPPTLAATRRYLLMLV